MLNYLFNRTTSRKFIIDAGNSSMEEVSEQTNLDTLLEGLRILVIDDEIDARELLSIILNYYGAQVITAASANEALTLVLQNGLKTLPDVIVSDIGMPDTDGCHFVEKLRQLDEEQGGKIPAIALSGFCSTTDRLRTISAG